MYYAPSQQVLQANGKASIDALRLSPNSSVLIMDTTAPLVWLCVSDSLGNVKSTAYDIKLHEEQIIGVEQRIANLETLINKLMEGRKNEPDAGNAKSDEPAL